MASQQDTQGSRILIVEDELIVAQDIREALAELGYRVVGAVDEGEAALAFIRDNPVDLVLMDIKIRGDMDGIDTAIRIRDIDATPVVFLTANTDRKMLERAKGAVPAAFLSKPFNDTDLGSAIELGLFRSRLESTLRESEERHRLLADNVSDVIWTRDLDCTLTYISPSVEKLCGFGVAELMVRSTFEEILTPESAVRIKTEVSSALDQPGGAGDDPERVLTLESEMLTRSGATVWVEDRIRFLRGPEGRRVGMLGITRDISERRHYERELLAGQERLVLALEGSEEGIWDWNLETGDTHLSAGLLEILDYSPGDLDGTWDGWNDLIHPEDKAGFMTAIEAYLAGSTDHFESEHRVRRRNGEYCWAQQRGKALRGNQDRPVRMVGAHRDVTAQKMRHPLTGLPSLTSFVASVDLAIRRTRSFTEAAFAVVAVEPHQLHRIQSTFGVTVTEEVLKTLAARIDSWSHLVAERVVDKLSIAMAEECRFLILVESEAVAEVLPVLIHSLGNELEAPMTLDGSELAVSRCVGVVLGDGAWSSAVELLQAATTAVGVARERGPGGLEFFNQSLRSQIAREIQLEMDLKHAARKEQFVLHFQPIVDLQSGDLAGLEALIRWQHPEEGLIQPGLFIPLAERSNLMGEVGTWVLEEACRSLKQWQDAGIVDSSIFMSVNLSAAQIDEPGLAHTVARVLQETQVAPSSLKLEITESLVMNDVQHSLDVLSRLRSLGVQFAIDDFGTGYSSLSHLQQFPIETLKIDQSFVSRLVDDDMEDSEGKVFLRTIVGLAKSLGLGLIAEGIENDHQRDHLRNLGCRYAQGFLFSKPIPGPEVGRKLLSRELNV